MFGHASDQGYTFSQMTLNNVAKQFDNVSEMKQSAENLDNLLNLLNNPQNRSTTPISSIGLDNEHLL